MYGTTELIASLDLGTTSARAIIFNAEGRPLAASQKPLTQYFPHDGCVEQDAEEIWQKQKECLLGTLADLKLSGSGLRALGITNQRETTIVWSKKTGKPIYRAIVWQDRRTAAFCERLHDSGFEPLIHDKTGLCLDPYFSASKVRWILDNVEGAREKALAGELLFGTVDSWLIWNLTGGLGHVTDVSNASRTLLFTTAAGMRNCWISSAFPRPCCLASFRAQVSSAGRRGQSSALLSISAAQPAISRQRRSGKRALSPA